VIIVAPTDCKYGKTEMYELRLPVNGEMVKIAELMPVLSRSGFPTSYLPSRFLDIGPGFAKGDVLHQARKAGPIDFSCENPNEVMQTHHASCFVAHKTTLMMHAYESAPWQPEKHMMVEM